MKESGFSAIEDKVLREKLSQLAHEFPIARIFYHPGKTTEPAQIIIITSQNEHVEIIESRKWIRNSRDKSNVLFYVIFHRKMDFEYRAGNPFITCYCQKSAIIYQASQANECFDTDWHSFKKKFKRYSEMYHHDRDILLSEANRFQPLGSLTGMFLTYLSTFEFDIRYLEILYIGHQFGSNNLHQRIRHLANFIPSIEGVFVKKNGIEYYLVSELEQGKEAAGDGDEIRLNEGLFESIVEAEVKLYQLISNRFSGLKRQIKSSTPAQTIAVEQEPSPKDKELSQIITHILKIQPVEEIYLFHQTRNDRTATYYLLLIGEGLGTRMLNRIQQSANSKFEGRLSVVLIGHSRIWIQTNLFFHIERSVMQCYGCKIWIQTNLFFHQSFFQKIMTPENLRFQSHQNHPSIHWENPHTPIYPDLEYYYRSSIRMTKQYFVLRDNAEKDITDGLIDLFGKSVLRIFRTFVFSKLSYLPNYLPAFNLWKLCVYADPKLENVEYLFEKCSGEDFFKEVDSHTEFYHGISRLAEEKLLIMVEILQLLLQKLESACTSIKDMNSGDILIHSDANKD
jgi:hypothetical protein